jgi:hypothetical protein
MRFAAIRCWKMMVEQREKLVSRPRAIKWKTSPNEYRRTFPRDSKRTAVHAPVTCSSTSSTPASFTFGQPLSACTSGPLTPGPRAAPLPITAESAAARSTCPGCPVSDTFCAAAARTQQQPPPPARVFGFACPQIRALPPSLLCFLPRSIRECRLRSCRRQPVHPASPNSKYVRCASSSAAYARATPGPPALPAPR